MKILSIILGIVCALCLMVILLFTSFELVAFDISHYSKEYEKLEIPSQVNMTADELNKVTAHMIDYLRDNNDSLNISTVVDGQQRMFFNDKELYHMKDVKELFQSMLFQTGHTIRNTAAIILLVCLIALFFTNTDVPKRLAISINICFLSVSAAFAVSGLIVYFNFSKYFTLFHEMFFSNDLWLLDPNTDLLINIVPEQFFVDTVVSMLLLFFSMELFLIVISLAILSYKKVNRKKIV